jgi:hypothetical protein
MITIKDFKGRIYDVLETGVTTTLLRCVKTGDHIRIRSYGWHEIGFVRP